jgi:hypothetical protein
MLLFYQVLQGCRSQLVDKLLNCRTITIVFIGGGDDVVVVVVAVAVVVAVQQLVNY